MTEKLRRVVSDTNIAVSAALWPGSTPGRALHRVIDRDQALLSPAMRSELIEVFQRSKFDKHLSLENRMAFLYTFFETTVAVRPVERVYDCVDPKDNMILECALSGRADIILTGDGHLLRLHPWRGIAILEPVQYLALDA